MNITVLTNLSTTNTVVSWGDPIQQTTILEKSNPNFVRAVQLSNNGLRIVRGTNSVGINTSTIISAAILVNPSLTWPPFFDAQPNADQFLQQSQVPVMGVTANSEVSLSYQWQKSSDLSNWSNVSSAGDYSGATSNALVINTANSSNFTSLAQAYRVRITTTAGTNNSNAGKLSLLTPPSNTSVAHPNAASFSVAAYGISNFSYFWQLSTDGGNTYSNIAESTPYSNTTTNHLNISNSTGLTGNKYRCVSNDSISALTSNAATLTVT